MHANVVCVSDVSGSDSTESCHSLGCSHNRNAISVNMAFLLVGYTVTGSTKPWTEPWWTHLLNFVCSNWDLKVSIGWPNHVSNNENVQI